LSEAGFDIHGGRVVWRWRRRSGDMQP
jgi:hypothetical protein